ncbi:thioredoxin domain-containing protein 6 [Entophlyctis luteolus]|nr:thioredoxin domain-containing protein 6 [Entophlyctis luteolus]
MTVDVPDESRLPDDVQVTPALATASTYTYVCSESCPSMRAEVSGYVPKPKQPARSARKSLFPKFVDKYCAPSLALASLVLVLALLLGPLRSAPTFAVKHSESKSSAPEFRIECGSCAFVPPENPATNRDQTAKMAGRGEKDVILVANDNDEFLNLISKPGVRVLEWTTNIDPAKFAGHCEPMTAIFKRFKQEFGDKFGVFRAVADSIDPLEKFRNQSCPTFLFFINRIFVKVVRGANAPVIERVIREHIELESGGHAHKPIVPDDTTRPILSFLSPDAVLLDEPSASAPPALHEKIGSTTSLSNVATATISTESSPETAEPPGDLEHTFAMLKPDSMFPSRIDEVMGLLYHHRFEIVGFKKVWLTKEQAAELYKENEKMDYFDRLVDYVSCAPVLMMRISKINAIQAWRDIVGPRDPKDARKDAPKSLRGLYGQDRLINSFHASDGPVSAARELEFAFGDSQNFISFPYESPDSPPNSSNSGLPQKTLAVIKPNAMLKVDEIIEKIVARGFSVIKREEVLLQTERAQELSLEFLETPQFEESVTFLTSGPVLLLTLKGENVIEGWLEMLGPSDPEIARQLFPMSLRAQFGVDAISNGLHGSQTVELAISQIHTFFPHFLNKAASLGSIFRTPLGSRQASKAGSKANLAPSMRASVVAIEAQREAMKAAAAAVGAAGNTIDSENTAEGVQPGATESAAAVTEEPEVLPVERTLALIKPDVYPAKKNEIIERIAAEGFTIVVEREVQFDKEKAAEFYKEHLGKGFYEELTDWMSSAPIYAMVLEKQGAVKAWRTLAGPTNSEKAREDSPQSIRAQYGTDGSKNAVHGSDSTTSSAREIAVVFGAEVAPEPELQRTLALIKPDVYPAKKDEIVARIRKNGFAIVKESEVFFDKEKAAEFYKEHLGKGFYEELTTWMSSAPIYALILEKPAAVKEWRNLAGPTNSNKARESSPFSIRALYGTDGSLNAVHGSDSVASAEREISVVFDMNQETSAKQVETKFSAPVSAITSKPASIIASRTASAKNMPADASPAADI